MLMFQPLIKYAEFSGRARRAEYWQFVAFQFGVGFVLGLMRGMSHGNAAMFSTITLLFQLAMFIPSLAVAVRRFHDINRTGWWVLFPMGVFIATTMIYVLLVGASVASELSKYSGGSMAGSDFTALGRSMGTMLLVIFLPTMAAAFVTFIFNVLPGTPGDNRFGPDPKGGASVDIARVFDAPEAELEAAAEAPHKPVFDFGPARGLPTVAEAKRVIAEPTPAPSSSWGVPAPAATTRPAFGKRR